jgi:hypothetical protein
LKEGNSGESRIFLVSGTIWDDVSYYGTVGGDSPTGRDVLRQAEIPIVCKGDAESRQCVKACLLQSLDL